MTDTAQVPPTLVTGPGAAVVFVHGLRTSGALWDPQMRVMQSLGHPARAVDLPGHGVGLGGRFTMAGAFAQIDAAVRSLPPGVPVVLVGLSLGGFTALHYAAARRGRSLPEGHALLGVVAASCSTDPHGKPLRLYRDVSSAVVTSGRRLREQTSALAALARSAHGQVPVRAGTRAPRADRPTWDVVCDALTALRPVSTAADLRATDVPVLLVNGRYDQLRLEESRLRRVRPGIDLVVIDHAGHDVSTDAPVAFDHAVLDFVDRVTPRPHTPNDAHAALAAAGRTTP